MVDIQYANAYSEVLEILKYISQEEYDKIPKTKIELFEINANKNHVFTYNPDKTLEEQNVSKITKGIIAILFRDYWATEAQREKIIAKQNYTRMKIEEEAKAKYDTDIFKNRNEEKQEKYTNEVMEYKESIFRKMVNKIKNMFQKK